MSPDSPKLLLVGPLNRRALAVVDAHALAESLPVALVDQKRLAVGGGIDALVGPTVALQITLE